MNITIKIVTVGLLSENCYIVKDNVTGIGVVIDPGADADIILNYIKEMHIKVKYIVNTHAHSDHIGANAAIKEATGAKLLVHAADRSMLTDAKENLSVFWGEAVVSIDADEVLKENDCIVFGESNFRVVHTPGHSPGGICLVGDKVIFSGDSLFAGSIGRCDFPGGSSDLLIHNLCEKIMILADDIRIYPGHGPETSIGWERVHNPYLIY